MNRQWMNALMLIAISGLVAASAAAGFATAPKVGDKAREFDLAAIDGSRVTLSGELAHGSVVLVLGRGWPGYQCPFCTRQFGDFLSHAKEFEAAGARVVWVYPGPSNGLVEHAAEFIANTPLPANFRVLTDPDYRVTVVYGLRWESPGETAYPATFVVDRASVVRFAQISNAHDGRATAADVLKALAALPRK